VIERSIDAIQGGTRRRQCECVFCRAGWGCGCLFVWPSRSSQYVYLSIFRPVLLAISVPLYVSVYLSYVLSLALCISLSSYLHRGGGAADVAARVRIFPVVSRCLFVMLVGHLSLHLSTYLLCFFVSLSLSFYLSISLSLFFYLFF
jgi:hypothetical protein